MVFRRVILLSALLTAALLQGSPSRVPPQAVTSPPVNRDSVLVALRAQISIMERSEDRLLSTVLWSLGAIAGLGLLLLGFSWFLNFKVYERDKSLMRDELR